MSVTEIAQKISPIFDAYHVTYAGIFGSVARGDDHAESDVDILVSLEKPISVYRFMELKEKLAHTLGREVDLVSKNSVQKYLEPYISKDLVTVYEKR